MTGPLDAGSYTLRHAAYVSSAPPPIRDDLIVRRAGMPDLPLASATGTPAANDAGTANPVVLTSSVTGTAVATRCGDQLVLRITNESTTTSLLELETTMSIP